METSREQDGNCNKERKTSKQLVLRQPPNESQIPDRRDATFTSHKQRCLVYLVFPSLRLLSMAEVQEEGEAGEGRRGSGATPQHLPGRLQVKAGTPAPVPRGTAVLGRPEHAHFSRNISGLSC